MWRGGLPPLLLDKEVSRAYGGSCGYSPFADDPVVKWRHAFPRTYPGIGKYSTATVWELSEHSASSALQSQAKRDPARFKRVPKTAFLNSVRSTLQSGESGRFKRCGLRNNGRIKHRPIPNSTVLEWKSSDRLQADAEGAEQMASLISS